MRIDVQIETLGLFQRMEKGQKRLAYAVVNAINAAAKEVQHAEFADVRDLFEIRRPSLFFGSPARPGGVAARIRPFASVGQGRPFAEIAVSPPPGRGLINRRLLLPLFEHGGERRPSVPSAHHVAVPITGGPARPSISSQIDPRFTFAKLAFAGYRGRTKVKTARRGRKSSVASLFGREGLLRSLVGDQALQYKGKERTFIIRPHASTSFPDGGVFRRISPTDIEPVYVFKPPFHLDDRLEFIPIAQRVGPRALHEHLERETIKALARDRGIS